jgi:hypothetical protein
MTKEFLNNLNNIIKEKNLEVKLNSNPKTKIKIKQIEKKLGFNLPDSYRIFLMNYEWIVAPPNIYGGIDACEFILAEKEGDKFLNTTLQNNLLFLGDNGDDIGFFLDLKIVDTSSESPVHAFLIGTKIEDQPKWLIDYNKYKFLNFKSFEDYLIFNLSQSA